MDEVRRFARCWVICFAVAATLLVGCGERSAGRPTTYTKGGLAFSRPAGWEVTEDVEESGVRYLFVEPPGEAVVIINIFPADVADEIQDFARDFAESTQEDPSVGRIGASTFDRVTKRDGYEVLTERFSISLLGVVVPHTRTYWRKTIDDRVCFITTQVADEDYSAVARGFEEIIASFKLDPP